jgi:cell wall-associated NlpC family hydrolase
MSPTKLFIIAVLLMALVPLAPLARADEQAIEATAEAIAAETPSLLQRAAASIQGTLETALDLVGIRYRRGGGSPDAGFDCSGFVGHVFREGLGLYLPRSAKAISLEGEPIARNELEPGDLVFFNTMRHAFSHVGIYLGDNRFIHAPRTGGRVRVEDMTQRYWSKRFDGARRIAER